VEERICPTGMTPGLGVAYPNNGTLTFFVDNTITGRTEITRNFGAATDTPVFGDFLGTTVTNIGIYRPSTGLWALDTANDGTVGRSFYFGGPGWIPVTGDVNGDGVTDAGVYNPSNGVWGFTTDLTGRVSVAFVYGGTKGDVPLMADFNHDGIDDPVIYNNGQWLVDTNSDRLPDQVYHMGGGTGGTPLAFDIYGTHDPALAVAYPRSDGQLLWAINPNRDGRTIGYYLYGAQGCTPFSGYFPTSSSIYVNPATGRDAAGAGTYATPYRTINAALAAAPAGSTIRLASGVYRENVRVVSKSNLKIVGTGMRSTIIYPASQDAIYILRSAGISLDDLWVASVGAEGRGVVVVASSVDTGLIRTNLTRWIGILGVNEGGTPATINARYSVFDQVTTGTGVYLQNGANATLYAISASQNGMGDDYRPDGGGIVVAGTSYAKVDRSVIVGNRHSGLIVNSTARLEMSNSYSAGSRLGNGALLFGGSTGIFVGNTFADNGTTFGASSGLNGLEIYDDFTGYAFVQGNQFLRNTASGMYIGSAPNQITIVGNTFSGNWSGVTMFGSQPRNVLARIVGNYFATPADLAVDSFGVAGIGSRVIATIGGAGGDANIFDGFRDYLFINRNHGGGSPYQELGYPNFTILGNTYRRRGSNIPASRAITPIT